MDNKIHYRRIPGQERIEMIRNKKIVGVIKPDGGGVVRAKLAAFLTLTTLETAEFSRRLSDLDREVRRKGVRPVPAPTGEPWR